MKLLQEKNLEHITHLKQMIVNANKEEYSNKFSPHLQ